MVALVWVAVAVVVVAVVWWWARRPPEPPPSRGRAGSSARPASPRTASPAAAAPAKGLPGPAAAAGAGAPGAEPTAAEPPKWPIPAELAQLQWVGAAALAEAERAALTTKLQRIPRPPRSFQQLVSPDFIARADSNAVAELIMGEPLVATRVLARVNSPAYGLSKPVMQIGHAVTFLGLNAVRGICVQYLLDESFKADTPQRQALFDGIWNASAVASELCVQLAQKLRLPEPGVMATHTVLAAVGHLASAALLPTEVAVGSARRDLLERTREDIQHLGAPAAELGALLMQSWQLPAELIDSVRRIDRMLVDPVGTGEAGAEMRAVSYLAARLGERLTLGRLESLEGFDVTADHGPDFYRWQSCLALPRLARLGDALKAPDLQAAVQRMRDGLKAGAGA